MAAAQVALVALVAGQVAAALVALVVGRAAVALVALVVGRVVGRVAGQVVGVRRVEGVSGLVLAIVGGLLALTQFASNQTGGLRGRLRVSPTKAVDAEDVFDAIALPEGFYDF